MAKALMVASLSTEVAVATQRSTTQSDEFWREKTAVPSLRPSPSQLPKQRSRLTARDASTRYRPAPAPHAAPSTRLMAFESETWITHELGASPWAVTRARVTS